MDTHPRITNQVSTKGYLRNKMKESFEEIINNQELFKGISHTDFLEILSFCKIRIYKPDSYIFENGQRGKEFFILLDGIVEITLPNDNDYGPRIFLITKGAMFGYSALFKPYVYNVTAESLTKAIIIAIKINPFLNFIFNKNSKL